MFTSRIGKAILTSSVISFAIFNALRGKSGVITQIPLISKHFPYHTQIMLLIQLLISLFQSVSVLYTDACIAFFGLEIMAASDILFEYISSNKERIQEDPDFLKIIAMRYCDIVDNINRFNNIVSIMNLVQFVTSAFLSLMIFFFIQLNLKNLFGYSLSFCVLFQLFIPCLFGEFIKIKMERLSPALYLTNWYDLSLKDQKSFLIILRVTQREYGIRAADMYDVNIYTFIQV